MDKCHILESDSDSEFQLTLPNPYKHRESSPRPRPRPPSPKVEILHPTPVPRTSGFRTRRDFEERMGINSSISQKEKSCSSYGAKHVLVLSVCLLLSALALFLLYNAGGPGGPDGPGGPGGSAGSSLHPLAAPLAAVGLLGAAAGLGALLAHACCCCLRPTRQGGLCGQLGCRERPLKVRLDYHNNDGYVDIDV